MRCAIICFLVYSLLFCTDLLIYTQTFNTVSITHTGIGPVRPKLVNGK